MPSLGILIGLPILAIALAALAAGFYLAQRWAKTADDFDHGLAVSLKWGAVAVAVIVTGIAALVLWPYKWAYHSWQPTTGTVQTISKRLISDGDHGMEERFVVRFTDGRQRACDDSRCSLLTPGMTLALRCKRSFQWGATPGYDCNYVDAR